MDNLLIYSDKNEPVTQAILRHKDHSQCGLLSLKELLNNVTIFDRISDDSTHIQWQVNDSKKITNDKKLFVINRVFSVPEILFSDFSSKDRKYAHAEFSAYLMFALAAFPCISE